MAPTNADYAKINIACKELGLDKYQLISDRYNLTTSKDLKPGQLQDLYMHFKSLGWRVKHKKKTSPRYEHAIQRKIVAMWLQMASAGVIKNSSDRALQAFVKRVTKVENLKWCSADQCCAVIEAIKHWGARNNVYFE